MENVKVIYNKLVRDGYPPKEAAKMAQERTGMSVVTGMPIKKDIPYRNKYTGQYTV